MDRKSLLISLRIARQQAKHMYTNRVLSFLACIAVVSFPRTQSRATYLSCTFLSTSRSNCSSISRIGARLLHRFPHSPPPPSTMKKEKRKTEKKTASFAVGGYVISVSLLSVSLVIIPLTELTNSSIAQTLTIMWIACNRVWFLSTYS